MFNPKYRVLLTAKCFPEEKFVCLGTQVILLVDFLKDFLPYHMWYGADVDAVGKNATRIDVNNVQLNLIGTDVDFVKYCSEIDQFIWGVFLCIEGIFSPQNIRCVELETEDESFRPIACDGVLVEIRAFDTSYLEIYSEDATIINKISKKFNLSE